MSTARDRAAAFRPGAEVAVAGLVLGLLVAALFAGDSFAVAAATLAAGGVVGAAALLGRLPLAPGAGLLVGALVALAAWNGLSVAWSVAPDRSWDELNRGLAYAAFAVLGAVLGSLGPRALRVAAAVLGAALALAILWALAGKAIPALFPDGGRAARLREPIGYWNALALAADALLVLGLWLAPPPGRRREPEPEHEQRVGGERQRVPVADRLPQARGATAVREERRDRLTRERPDDRERERRPEHGRCDSERARAERPQHRSEHREGGVGEPAVELVPRAVRSDGPGDGEAVPRRQGHERADEQARAGREREPSEQRG
ncbi:MAG TPA: hypothetical protein VNT23_04255, partial [Gaiellaceae bacterium]|nr:hypothetical protein [Gaiellaceae bacterium]